MQSSTTAPGESARAPTESLTAAGFLRLLWPNFDELGHHVNVWTAEGRKSQWFSVHNLDEAGATVEGLASRKNVYIGTALIDLKARKLQAEREQRDKVGTVNTGAIRGTADTAVAIPGVWLDLDIGGPVHGAAHKNTKLPPTREAALALIDEALPLRPTLLIDSGHGLYAWWLFAEPWWFENDEEREDAANLVYRLQETIRAKAAAHGWDVDGTADLARLLRPVGAINRKLEPVPVQLIECDEHRRYQPDDFDRYLIDVEWRRVVAEPVDLADELPKIDLDLLQLKPWIKKLIRDGNEWQEEKNAWRYGSRSQAVWRVTNEMVEAGHDDDTIAGVLLDPRYAISENPTEKGRRARAFVAREIGKARKHQEKKPKGSTLDLSGGGFAAPPRVNGTHGTGKTLGPIDGADRAPCPERPEANAQTHEPAPPTTNGAAHHEDAADADAEPAAAPTFNQTEMGLSELLVHRHGRDLRYCFPWASFLAWDGRRYQRDRTGEARRRAKETVRSVYAVAAKTEDDKQRRALLDWAKTFEKAAKVAAILTLAEAEPGIPIVPEEMDANPYLFNVLNGTVDLRTGNLRPHDRADNITKLAPVAYDATAECPTFLAFLERVVPDAHVRDFLRRFVGYCLTGDTSEQCLCFLHGAGANGKSTLLGILLELLGDYAKQAAPDLLTNKTGDRHPTELADLFGARLVTSVEVDEGKRLAETLVKQMTGGDRMKARFMRGDFFEWQPTHKLLLAANHRPVIRGTDFAIWRRIHLLPFEVTIPESERDPRLPSKLRAELPGILNWAIRGCLEWQRDGLGVPKAVKDATADYRAEQDVLGDFLGERCIKDAQAFVATAALYKAYTGWCEDGGEKPVNKTAFGRGLTERGFEARKGAKGVRIWVGLRLAGVDEEPGGGFGAGGAFGRDFPYNSSRSSREGDIPKNAPNAPPEDNAPPDDGLCPACRRDLTSEELPCPVCVEVTA